MPYVSVITAAKRTAYGFDAEVAFTIYNDDGSMQYSTRQRRVSIGYKDRSSAEAAAVKWVRDTCAPWFLKLPLAKP